MKFLRILSILFLSQAMHSGSLFAQQSFTYTKCALYNSGSIYYYNYHKTFNSVPLASDDIQLQVSFLGCNPYAVNSGGIRLSGTTFVQPDVPVGNCGYLQTVYTIDKTVFNQAVTAGSGSITFDFYIRDQCASGMGCSFYSDPCVKIDFLVDTTCVPTSSVQTVTSCGPHLWIDGTTYPTSNNTATHTLTNAGGCDSTVTLNLTVGDNTAPVADLATLSDVTEQCSVTALTAPTATDNCVGTVTGTHNAILPITTEGITVVTWTYDDGSGNTSTQMQNVVIADDTAPVADLATLSDVTSQCSVTALTAPTATDNCVGTISGTHNASLPITTQGTTVVTWTYDDGHGNTSTQTQNVVIIDNTAPVADIATLQDVTGQCSVTILTAPSATDNCAGTISGTHNANLPITTQGTTVVTWTYDDGHGNTSTQTQNVVITDNTAPVADLATLSDVTEQCSVTALTAPTATDNCVGTVTGTHNASLPITTEGITVVTWTYDDGHGNTSTQTQNVVITDNTAPVADLATLSDVTSQCSVTALTAPTATDNCVGTVTGTHNAILPITTEGITVVTWTYDDGHGNTSTQTQNVIITDNTAPVADIATLQDVTEQCSVTILTAPSATDNCIGTVTGMHNAILPITTQGTTVVTWTYDDGQGNMSTQTQNVVITDNTVPVADLATLSDVTSQCSVTALTAPTATDNCVGTISGTHNASLPITTQGTTVVTWTYDDGHGNTSTQMQQVIITPIDNGITQVSPITLQADAVGYSYQWVDCNNGNAPVAGATAQSFTPATAGSYACEVGNGACTVLTDCLLSSLGVAENDFGTVLSVYPNPTSGVVTIALGEVVNGVTVNTFNALGQLIDAVFFTSTDAVHVSLKGEPGMYLLEIQTEGESVKVHVIKN